MGMPVSGAGTPLPPMPIDPRMSMAMSAGRMSYHPQQHMMTPEMGYDPRMSQHAASPIPSMNMMGPQAVRNSQAYIPQTTLAAPDTSSMYGGGYAASDVHSNLQGGGTPGMMQMGLLPNDEQLTEAIRQILANSDLQSITKKRVREQLSHQFGVDLTSRKEFIGDAIELILNGQL